MQSVLTSITGNRNKWDDKNVSSGPKTQNSDIIYLSKSN